MTERCIVRVKFTPADGRVGQMVGGFLRYVQHRDLHPGSRVDPQIAGLVKYVAYRDKAASRAELFGSDEVRGTKGRKDFVDFVLRSLAGSAPQVFRSRDGGLVDRRRAVSRLVISPERSRGLDLERLTRTAMASLAAESGGHLQWIAAIHRNTPHHHIHLIVAGMRQEMSGGYRRADITKPRLAAMKHAIALEIERQRGERVAVRITSRGSDDRRPRAWSPIRRPAIAASPVVAAAYPRRPMHRSFRQSYLPNALARLGAVARRYQRRIEREAEEEIRRRHWELAA